MIWAEPHHCHLRQFRYEMGLSMYRNEHVRKILRLPTPAIVLIGAASIAHSASNLARCQRIAIF